MNKKVVMADVARMAEVSVQTVSRVLRGHNSVRPETRQRVIAAVDALGYAPDLVAQALASGSTRSIGVLVVGELWYGMERTFIALENAQRKQGRYLFLATAPAEDFSKVVAAMRFLQQCKVQAIVIFSQREDVVTRLAKHILVPTVLVGVSSMKVPQASAIAISQADAVDKLVQHFASQGCKKIVHIAAPNTEFDAAVRKEAFLTACQRLGLESQIVFAEGWGCQDGAKAGDSVASIAEFDAIYAANDNIALGVASRLRQCGLLAARDYALAGFDDIEIADYIAPTLTTARQDVTELARLISAEIAYLISGGIPRRVTLEIEVILRESTLAYSP